MKKSTFKIQCWYANWLKPLLLVLLLTGATHLEMSAAVNGYTFSQASGAYTNLSASRAIVFTATAGATLDPGLGDDRNFTLAAGTIPFSFTFSGTAYTGLNINTNGYVTFGATLPTTSDRNGLTNTTAWDASIVAVGRDLSANTDAANLGEISYEVLGSAPNRIFVIQYSKFRRFASSTPMTENFNFQIRLNEGGGVASAQTVDVVYGACVSTSTSTTATAQSLVGLRGATTADFRNRTQTTGWLASTAGATNTTSISMRHTAAISPASGLTFTWTPPALCAVANGGTITPATFSKCSGQTYNMVSTGVSLGIGTTYQWQVSNTAGGPYAPVVGGTGATTASYTTAALTPGTYYYVLTTTCANCGPCSGNSNELTLTVNALPLVTVTPSSGTLCQPGATAVNLTAGGALTYTWSPTAGLTPTSGSPVDALPASATTYTVSGTDVNGCIGTATASIVVNAAVVINSVSASPDNVCIGGSSTLTAAAGFSVGAYCASTHSSGCSGDDITNVSLASIVNPTTGCGGAAHYTYFNSGGAQTTNLDVTFGAYSLAVSFGTDGNQYFGAWIDYNQNGSFEATEFLGASTNAGASGTTSVSFTVPGTAYNGKTRLRIVGGNDAAVTATQACGVSSSNWGETQDYDVTILNGTNPFSYAWSESPANATLTSTNTNPTSAVGITVNETYQVTVTSAAGCSTTGSVNVVAGTPLSCTNITTTASCEGQNFTLTANKAGGGSPFTYVWSDGMGGVYPDAASVTANLAAGTYTFSVTVSDGCGGLCSMSQSITVNPLPGGVASGPATGLTGVSGIYTVTGYLPGSTFQWRFSTVSGGPYTNILGATSDIQGITFGAIGNYYMDVVVTSAVGCQSTSSEVPTSIALNGDNVCGAIPIVVGVNGTYSNVGATVEPGEAQPPTTSCGTQNSWCPAPNGSISNTVWFSFVAPPTGRVSIHFLPGNWDSQMALWSASNCSDLLSGAGTLVAANDDSASSPFNAWIAPVCLVPGNTYYIQVDGYSTNTNAAFSLYLEEVITGIGLKFASKAMLAGAYDAGNGLMHDSLRASGMVPLTEPYSIGYGKLVMSEASGETTTSTILSVTGPNADYELDLSRITISC